MKIYSKLLILFVLGILMFTSCSPKGGYKVLSYFFDGIPDSLRNTETEAVKPVFTTDTVTVHTEPSSVLNPDYFYHTPYSKQECTACHDKSSRSNTIRPQPELCYTCHEEFKKKYTILHGPVAGGYCTKCHAPHMSQYPKLLKKQGQDLCVQCHSISDILINQKHQGIGSTDCLSCHLPHGSNKSYLLK